MEKIIYVDNAATTPISAPVLDSMFPFLKTHFGNPSSIYSVGQTAKKAMEEARATIAECLGATPREIYFTSGGSEADNWAIKGVARTMLKKGKNHIITSKFEHHAVLHTVQALEKEGFTVTYLDVHDDGIVQVDELENSITDKTALVSIMYANNEIGTIQPIPEIGEVCRRHNVLFHTDAVQAVGHLRIDVVEQNIDLLSLSAHKFHGPKGIGALYVKNGVVLQNLIEGGAQERRRRAGTENVAEIVGMAKALKIACEDIEYQNEKLITTRDKLIENLLKIEHTRLNGHPKKRLAGNINVSFSGIEGESLLLMLDAKGICASSGSACTSGALDPSHVLLAIGLPHEIAHGSLRITLSGENSMADVDYILEVLPPIVAKLRSMSPLWEKFSRENT